jgi:hypothetical protein
VGSSGGIRCLATGLAIRRWEGALLLLAYSGYLTIVLVAGTNHPLPGPTTTALVIGLALLTATITAVGWVSGRNDPSAHSARYPTRVRVDGLRVT